MYFAKDARRGDTWFLDTGASNHMTGYQSVFAELDMFVIGTVKFGDRLVVDIQGRGMILFACANGEHHALTDVYYIPSLRNNIGSLGQLDENGCQVAIRDGYLSYTIGGNVCSPRCQGHGTGCTSSRWTSPSRCVSLRCTTTPLGGGTHDTTT
jgi:hypothetical protein